MQLKQKAILLINRILQRRTSARVGEAFRSRNIRTSQARVFGQGNIAMVFIARIRHWTNQRVVIGVEVWVRGREDSVCCSDDGADSMGGGHFFLLLILLYVMLGLFVVLGGIRKRVRGEVEGLMLLGTFDLMIVEVSLPVSS